MKTRGYPSIVAFCAWFAACASDAAKADIPCISSQLYCNSPIDSSDPTGQKCCSNVYGFSCASYDIPAGMLSAYGNDGAQVAMIDSFHVAGPAEGTPLEFTAQLILSGQASRVSCTHGAAAVRGRVSEGSSTPAEALAIAPPCGTTYLDTTVEVQVHRLAGERFQINAFVSFGGYEGGSGSIYGTLRFAGLPEGASVVSCNGFYQGPPVPVAPASWGRLKTRYR